MRDFTDRASLLKEAKKGLIGKIGRWYLNRKFGGYYQMGRVHFESIDLSVELFPGQAYHELNPPEGIKDNCEDAMANTHVALFDSAMIVTTIIPPYEEPGYTYCRAHEEAHAASMFGAGTRFLEKAKRLGWDVDGSLLELVADHDTLMNEAGYMTSMHHAQKDKDWRKDFSHRLHNFMEEYYDNIDRIGYLGSEIATVLKGDSIMNAFILHLKYSHAPPKLELI